MQIGRAVVDHDGASPSDRLQAVEEPQGTGIEHLGGVSVDRPASREGIPADRGIEQGLDEPGLADPRQVRKPDDAVRLRQDAAHGLDPRRGIQGRPATRSARHKADVLVEEVVGAERKRIARPVAPGVPSLERLADPDAKPSDGIGMPVGPGCQALAIVEVHVQARGIRTSPQGRAHGLPPS